MKKFVSLDMNEELQAELQAEEGSTVLITIKSSKYAVWSHGGVIIPHLQNYSEYVKSSNGHTISIKIPFIQIEDSGIWIVELYDRLNLATPPDVKSCLIKVTEKTMGTVEKVEVLGTLGKEIILDVSGIGQEEGQVQWELPNRIVVPGTKSYSIPSVSYRDSGRYIASYTIGNSTVRKLFFLNVEGPPDPVRGLMVKARGDKIEASWNGCSFDGGSNVHHYIVSYQDTDNKQLEEAQTSRLSFSIDKNGTEPRDGYVFKVAAVNRHGVGQWSSAEFSNRIEIQTEGFDFYVKMEELGKGRFGTVFRVVKGGKEYAGKFIKCIRAMDKEKAKQEIEILSMVKGHEKLVQILAAFQLSREIVILTELLKGGELFERIVADDFNLTENKCREFVEEILLGIQYIHQKSIIHLDIKPENILITPSGLKIIDFGLSQKYDPNVKQCVLFGTPEFVSPEIINYEPIGFYCDVWSIGVLTYVLISGLSPFMGNSDSETFSNVTRGEFDFDDEAFDEVSQECLGFIRGCLAIPNTNRLSCAECLNHGWMQQTSDAEIKKDKLKGFVLRRKWQKTGNAIRAIGRLKSRCSTTSSSGHDES